MPGLRERFRSGYGEYDHENYTIDFEASGDWCIAFHCHGTVENYSSPAECFDIVQHTPWRYMFGIKSKKQNSHRFRFTDECISTLVQKMRPSPMLSDGDIMCSSSEVKVGAGWEKDIAVFLRCTDSSTNSYGIVCSLVSGRFEVEQCKWKGNFRYDHLASTIRVHLV